MRGRGLRAVVGNRGRLDDDVAVLETIQHGPGHLLGGLNPDDIDIEGIGQHGRTGDQRHAGTAVFGGPGHGKPHFTGRGVADEAHRIDRLARRTGGHQHPLVFKILGCQTADQSVKDLRRFRQTARADRAAGQIPCPRLHNAVAVASQDIEVPLNRATAVHVGVHGRAKNYRRGHHHHHGGEGVVGNAVGQLTDQVGRGRCNHDGIGLGRPIDVPKRSLVRLLEEAGADRTTREGLKRHPADEVLRVAGHHHPDGGLLAGHEAQQFDALVCGDAAADAQNDIFVFQSVGHFNRPSELSQHNRTGCIGVQNVTSFFSEPHPNLAEFGQLYLRSPEPVSDSVGANQILV